MAFVRDLQILIDLFKPVKSSTKVISKLVWKQAFHFLFLTLFSLSLHFLFKSSFNLLNDKQNYELSELIPSLYIAA